MYNKNKLLLFMLICVSLLFLVTSCENPETAHLHSFVISESGELKCSGCSEHINSGFIAVVQSESNWTVKNYAMLTESSTNEIELNVNGSDIEYKNAGEGRCVIINSTSSQDVTINAPKDSVTHFGGANIVDIQAVADHSYTGKAEIKDTVKIAQGNINLEVNVPKVEVEAVGSVSVNFGEDVTVSSVKLETKSGYSTQNVKVGGTGKVSTLETSTPVTIEANVDAIDVKSENVSITLSGDAQVKDVVVDEGLFSSEKLSITLKGNAEVNGITGLDGSALALDTTDSTSPALHVHIWTVVKEPTCEETGLRKCSEASCSVESEEIQALGHDLEHHGAKAATCTEIGWDAYDTCKREGCTYTTYSEKPVLGHDIEHHAEKTATCAEIGWDAYDTCKREGCTYTTYSEKGKLEHVIIHYPAQTPSESQPGWAAYDECKNCTYTTFSYIPLYEVCFVSMVEYRNDEDVYKLAFSVNDKGDLQIMIDEMAVLGTYSIDPTEGITCRYMEGPDSVVTARIMKTPDTKFTSFEDFQQASSCYMLRNDGCDDRMTYQWIAKNCTSHRVTVHFADDYNDYFRIPEGTVADARLLSQLATNYTEYVFYLDSDYKTPFDFTTPITDDIVLYCPMQQ